jgi:hypothetical protein
MVSRWRSGVKIKAAAIVASVCVGIKSVMANVPARAASQDLADRDRTEMPHIDADIELPPLRL